jgi:hypothetical protein
MKPTSPGSLRLKSVDIRSDARRRALRWALGNALQLPIPTTCSECGKTLPDRRRKFCSNPCAQSYYGGTPVPATLMAIPRAAAAARTRCRLAPTGRALHRSVRSSGLNRDIMSVRSWRQQEEWSEALDAQMREWFQAVLLPRLKDVRPVTIHQITGVRTNYAAEIKRGDKTLMPAEGLHGAPIYSWALPSLRRHRKSGPSLDGYDKGRARVAPWGGAVDGINDLEASVIVGAFEFSNYRGIDRVIRHTKPFP